MKITEAMKLHILNALTDTDDAHHQSEAVIEQVSEALTGRDVAPGWQWESSNPTIRERYRNVAEYGTERPSVHAQVLVALGGVPIRHYAPTSRQTGSDGGVTEHDAPVSSWITD